MRTATSHAPVLLDTHFWLWFQTGDAARVRFQERELVERAANEGRIRLSAISVWEVATLVAKNRLRLNGDLSLWMRTALAMRGLQVVPVTPEIALESVLLPGQFHADPADRIIVATARVHRARLLTRDKAILKYARQHALPLVNA